MIAKAAYRPTASVAKVDVFLVGGAVRDPLLGRESKDRDWVVVGSSPEQMLAAGFRPVGRDFPVFLHPETKEEYALARTERKSGHGYHGFTFLASPDVTLEQDLARRDFTINAIAQSPSGELIDPYGGVNDIKSRVLRHVSNAFVEDPVRVLRAARFMARFAPLGFVIADETRELMRSMAASGELGHLVAERVWQELYKALGEAKPSAFLRCLRECEALSVLLPEVDALYGVPQRAEFHPEIDTGIHTEMVLDMAARVAPGDAVLAFCALTHDLGKALTPSEQLPRHIGHEHHGLAPLHKLCARYKVPAETAALAEIVCREHLNVHRLFELRADTVYELIARCDGFRKPQRIAQLALACEADKRGRLGQNETDYPSRQHLLKLHAAALAITASQAIAQGLQGEAIGAWMKQARIAAIKAAQKGEPTK